ncbi:2TM domain-containing protein [Flavobacterium sp. CYK-55]|uniref:2TM domain-containing protein n=1 Tax=Flavobacterium sp. CYK-55 TaxID=2835529 RepID=UPI0020C0DB3F|nr:2TM domain-containing protein [Flavobacterium sp. CYK-55]
MNNHLKSQQNQMDTEYQWAYKRVKKLKSFYTHLMVYIIVNIFIMIARQSPDSAEENLTFWSFENFSVVFFWGFGLAMHAFSVFGQDWFLGKRWEENKIKELMRREEQRNV